MKILKQISDWRPHYPQENLRLLCCVGSDEGRGSPGRRSSQERLRQIERAFNKFDLNGDGFLSWEEFLQIGLDQETASRIFSACSKEVRGPAGVEELLVTVCDFRSSPERSALISSKVSPPHYRASEVCWSPKEMLLELSLITLHYPNK